MCINYLYDFTRVNKNCRKNADTVSYVRDSSEHEHRLSRAQRPGDIHVA